MLFLSTNMAVGALVPCPLPVPAIEGVSQICLTFFFPPQRVPRRPLQVLTVLARDVMKVWTCFGITESTFKKPERQLTAMSAAYAEVPAPCLMSRSVGARSLEGYTGNDGYLLCVLAVLQFGQNRCGWATCKTDTKIMRRADHRATSGRPCSRTSRSQWA